MSEGTQTVQQQTQDEQYLQQAQDFFGQSMGRIKGRMQSDSAQLQSYMQQLPEETQAQIQEMTNSYSQFQGTIDQAAQDAGVQDALEESAEQARQNADQASGQGPTDVAADQAQQVAGQAQDAAGQAAGQVQDTAGQAAQQGQQSAQQATGGGAQQQPNATHAAQQKAQELGVDLSQMQGSGAGGRVTIRDVIGTSNQ
jgi:pyruvate/2-oxoglutarate dehydrogenase complex dihydrolipoamide acyltransferase (E2) component